MSKKNATVTLNSDTLATEWNGLSVGKRFKVMNGGKVEYYFVPSKIEPTFAGSAFAWITGERVNGRGVRVQQISHRHCPEGERMELIHTGMIG